MTEEYSYDKYRGKCKEFCEAAIAEDPTLTLVRGFYYCPYWGTEEQHWWTTRPDGTIFDPTAAQFPSKGMGIYVPFDGMCTCEECGRKIPEHRARFDGRHVFCSYKCNGMAVGVL